MSGWYVNSITIKRYNGEITTSKIDSTGTFKLIYFNNNWNVLKISSTIPN